MSYQLIGRNSLLPQVPLTARTRTAVKDINNPFENVNNTITYVERIINECSVQPVGDRAMKDMENQLGMDGMKNYEAYYLYTSDRLIVSVEGTNVLSDQVKLQSVTGQELWFTALRALNFPYTGVARYKYLVILQSDLL